MDLRSILTCALVVGFVFCMDRQFALADGHALLIGCSKYEQNGIQPLVGAENDVAAFDRLLRDRFDFNNVHKLSGWPDDPSRRPTFENIVAAFDRLIGSVSANDQVVVLMSGHGWRFPVPKAQSDLLAKHNPEPDGFDEAFLPADYSAGKRMILDNQIGEWLTQLRGRGAHVTMIFDSCFSGTMTRGGEPHVSRTISQSQSGVPSDAMVAARTRAASENLITSNVLPRRSDGLEGVSASDVDDASSGSVVAFYAAQSFEKAIELTRPKTAKKNDARFMRGLLSYHLEQLLWNQEEGLSYGDLARALVARYVADGRRWPTPFWEGAMDREVLGLRKWPNKGSIRLQQSETGPKLNLGELAGISRGTILAVYDPNDKDFATLRGRVVVREASLSAATVTGYEGEDVAKLPNNGLCRILSRDFGETRVKLNVLCNDTALRDTLSEIANQASTCFRLVEDRASASWIFLVRETPSGENGGSSTELHGLLLPVGHLTQTNPPQIITELSKIPHSQFQLPSTDNYRRLVTDLEIELQKVRAWQFLWKVAGEYAPPSPIAAKQRVRLEVRKPDASLVGSLLSPGESVQLRIVTTSFDAHWYLLFYLDGRLGIRLVKEGQISGRNRQDVLENSVEHRLGKFTLNSDSIGTNGFLLLAIPQDKHPHKPDYRFLSQSGLGNHQLARSPVNMRGKSFAFQDVLRSCVEPSKPVSRSAVSLDEPQVSSWIWRSQTAAE